MRLERGEREAFAGDPASLDWRRYWIDVHVPGLRRWIYPRLEGKRPPREPRRELSLARLEGKIVFNAILDRFEDLQLVDQEILWAQNSLIRGVDRLLVDYRKRPISRFDQTPATAGNRA